MASVTLQSVSKRFGETAVVNSVSLDIIDREFLVFVGPSGCGKTTTLRMIAGLESISDGKIFIGERLVNEVSPKDRDIAMVFQNYALYPHMNVYDNMAFGLQMRKMPKAEIDQRVKEAAEILGLGALLARKPKEMSGGQRQRVALGRAIVRHPAVFLMDEPLSNLDAKLRVQTRGEIVKLHKRVATTAIYVTHDQVEAMTMGDRIVVMKDGDVQQVGTPKQIYDHPANLFVAGFMGSPSMSFLNARLVADGEALFAKAASFSIRIPEERRAACLAARDKAITLGVRPEDFTLNSTAVGAIPAVVDVVEPLGPESIVHLSSEGQPIIARAPAEAIIKMGDAIALDVNVRRMHLFDPNSGAAYF